MTTKTDERIVAYCLVILAFSFICIAVYFFCGKTPVY